MPSALSAFSRSTARSMSAIITVSVISSTRWPGLERPLQVGAHLEPLDHLAVHVGLEDAVAALALALGHVHGDVGVAQQVGRVGGAVAGQAQADARIDHELLLAHVDRRGEPLE